jgi:UDP-glucose 4-epimerase
VIPKWIWRAMKNQPLVLFGDGNQTRDFTYVDTVIDILEGVLSANLGHEDPINLAFGNRISLNSVVSLLKEHFPNLVVERQASRKGDVLDSQSDGVYVRQNFPEVVPVPFEVGLKKTINWFFEEGWEVINSPQIID